MRRLTLIRHGLTEGNVRRWYYGALAPFIFITLLTTSFISIPTPSVISAIVHIGCAFIQSSIALFSLLKLFSPLSIEIERDMGYK